MLMKTNPIKYLTAPFLLLTTQQVMAFDFDVMNERSPPVAEPVSEQKSESSGKSDNNNSLVPEVNFVDGGGLSPTVKYLFKKDYSNGIRLAANGTLNGNFEASKEDDLVTNYIATNGNLYFSGALSYQKEVFTDTKMYIGGAFGVSKVKYNQEMSDESNFEIESDIAFFKLNTTINVDNFAISYEYATYSVSGADGSVGFEERLNESDSQAVNILIPAKRNGQTIWLNGTVIKPEGDDWTFILGVKTSIDLF